jgi:hypothetical protein
MIFSIRVDYRSFAGFYVLCGRVSGSVTLIVDSSTLNGSVVSGGSLDRHWFGDLVPDGIGRSDVFDVTFSSVAGLKLLME